MRQIDFSDGYETSAAPDQGVISSGGFGSYSSDAAFVTALTLAGGTLGAGNAYYNSVDKRIHFYNGSVWIVSTAKIDGVFFLPQYADDTAAAAALAAAGGTLAQGAQYWNTATKTHKVYDGSAWHAQLQADLQQTITNKDYDGGTASNSRRMTIPKGTFAAVNALTKKAGNLYYVTDGGGSIYFDNGTSLSNVVGANVDSVNGLVGVVVLTTDDIAEDGSPVNLWFTDARAKAAAVADTIADGVTDVAPSQNAVFDALALKEDLTNKGANNGYAPLDGSGKVPTANLPSAIAGAVSYQGTWNANSNSPALADGTGSKGFYYVVSNAGTTTLDTINEWAVGDWVIFNGTVWEKVDNTDKVFSVNTQTGAVVLDTDDISDSASTNKYFTSAAAKAAAVADAIVDAVTDVAPSQNAVFDALAGKLDTSSDTDDIPEGTNKYFTDARAKAAAVADTITDAVTDVAPSQNAVFDALAGKLDTGSSTSVVPEGTNKYFTDARAKAASVADTIADAVTDVAPSQNAVFDALATKAAVGANTDITSLGGITGPIATVSYEEFAEQGSAPSTPAADKIRLYADDVNGFTRMRLLDDGGKALTLCRDSVFVAKNITGATLTKGTPVQVSGVTTGGLTIAKASAAFQSTSNPCTGLLIEDVADAAFGRVMLMGLLTGLNTSALSAGSRLYLGLTAGTLTTTKPENPNLVQRLGNVLTSNATTGQIQIRVQEVENEDSESSSVMSLFGDGSDGDVTIGSNTTLTRDMYYNNLTVSATFTLTTGGFKIYVRGKAQIDGTIDASGATGGGTGGGSGGSTATLGVGANGGAGTTTIGTAGSNTTNGTGGAGGAGGAGTGGAGGAGGTVAALIAAGGSIQQVKHPNVALTGYSYLLGAKLSGGAGGGGGGGDTSATGAGGGGAGRVLLLAGRYIIGAGTVRAKGGNGGAGVATNRGGGGGGGGGTILVTSQNDTTLTSLTFDVSGGTGGASGGGGASAGSAGSTGNVFRLII